MIFLEVPSDGNNSSDFIGFGWFWWLGLCFIRLEMSLAGCNSPDAKYTLHEMTYHLSLALTSCNFNGKHLTHSTSWLGGGFQPN